MSKKSYDRRKKLKKKRGLSTPSLEYVNHKLLNKTKPEDRINGLISGNERIPDIILDFIEAENVEPGSEEVVVKIVELGIQLWNAMTYKDKGIEEPYETLMDSYGHSPAIIKAYEYFEKRKKEKFADYNFIVSEYKIGIDKMNKIVLSVTANLYKAE